MATRPFFDTLRDLRYGQILDEAAEEFQKVVVSVQETGKVGELTIKLKVKPASRGQGAYEVEDDITAKLPKLPRGSTIMFGTPEGNLVKTDPKQQSLTLKSVTDEAGAAGEKLRNVS